MATLTELTKGLTPTQKKAFLKLLNSGKEMSSYSLGVRLTTMRALEKKGLVRSKWGGVPVMAEINLGWRARYKKTK